MARPLRIEFPGAWYHVMNRGAARRSVFNRDRHFLLFLDLLDETSRRFGIEVHAYCVMKNHYHLIIHTPEGNLSRAMRHINGVYTQRYNLYEKIDGPLFKGRYKSILIEKEGYLLMLSRYIHRNPLQAGIVKVLGGYKWSSYPAYIKIVDAPSWLHRTEVFSFLGYTNVYDEYKEYVEGGSDDGVSEFYNKKHLPPVLGGDEFKKKVFRSEEERSREISGAGLILEEVPAHLIIEEVSRRFGIPVYDITEAKRGKGKKNIPRMVAMRLCQTLGRKKLSDIAKVFNVGHYSTVSSSIRILRKEVESNKKLQNVINILTQDLTR